MSGDIWGTLGLSAVPFESVDLDKAIRHALDESQKCLDLGLWCASLAMMRRALDLWSQYQRDRLFYCHFDKTKGEKDDLYWRLTKIAEANPMYQNSIHGIMQDLRIDGNEVLHMPNIVSGCGDLPALYGDSALRDLLRQLERLVMTTMPPPETTERSM